MRIILLIFVSILLTTSNLHAQYDEKEDGIRTRYRPGILWYFTGYKPFKAGKLHKYDRFIIDLTYNDWHGDRKAFSSPLSSIGVNVAFMFDLPLTQGNTFGLGIGLGYSHYKNRSKIAFTRDLDLETTTIADLAQDPKKAKFAANYFEIPLELRFRTKGFNHFKFMVGGKIGIKANSFSKTVEETNGQRITTKTKRFPDANLLRYGITARIGIRNWAIYGAYYFSPLFKNEESVQLYPFSLGVSVSLF